MNDNPNAQLLPGMLVRHPEHPQWGVGQVQSNIAERTTVMFENAGKVVIPAGCAALEIVVDT